MTRPNARDVHDERRFGGRQGMGESLLEIDAKYGDVISTDEAIAAVETARRPRSTSRS